jgi:hypothetical protein
MLEAWRCLRRGDEGEDERELSLERQFDGREASRC